MYSTLRLFLGLVLALPCVVTSTEISRGVPKDKKIDVDLDQNINNGTNNAHSISLSDLNQNEYYKTDNKTEKLFLGTVLNDKDQNKTSPLKLQAAEPYKKPGVDSGRPSSKELFEKINRKSFSKNGARSNNARSMDIQKYISADFHNSNNEYVLPISDSIKKYVSEDDSVVVERTTKFLIDDKLTTPSSEYFDKKYKQTVDSVNQKLEQNDFEQSTFENSEEHSSSNSDFGINDDKVKTDLTYRNEKKISLNETNSKNSIHKDVTVEKQTNLETESLFNDTVLINGQSQDENELKKLSDTNSKDVNIADPKFDETTTRKLPITKSSTSNNDVEIINNKIESDKDKTVSPTTNIYTSRRKSQKNYSLSPLSRGSVKYLSSLLPTTSVSLRKLTQNRFEEPIPEEQTAQENQIKPHFEVFFPHNISLYNSSTIYQDTTPVSAVDNSSLDLSNNFVINDTFDVNNVSKNKVNKINVNATERISNVQLTTSLNNSKTSLLTTTENLLETINHIANTTRDIENVTKKVPASVQRTTADLESTLSSELQTNDKILQNITKTIGFSVTTGKNSDIQDGNALVHETTQGTLSPSINEITAPGTNSTEEEIDTKTISKDSDLFTTDKKNETFKNVNLSTFHDDNISVLNNTETDIVEDTTAPVFDKTTSELSRTSKNFKLSSSDDITSTTTYDRYVQTTLTILEQTTFNDIDSKVNHSIKGVTDNSTEDTTTKMETETFIKNDTKTTSLWNTEDKTSTVQEETTLIDDLTTNKNGTSKVITVTESVPEDTTLFTTTRLDTESTIFDDTKATHFLKPEDRNEYATSSTEGMETPTSTEFSIFVKDPTETSSKSVTDITSQTSKETTIFEKTIESTEPLITTEIQFVHITTINNQTTIVPDTFNPGDKYITPNKTKTKPVTTDSPHEPATDMTEASKTILPPATFKPSDKYLIRNKTKTKLAASTSSTDEPATYTTEAHKIEDNSEETNNGTIIAIVISCVGGICLIILAGLLIIMRKRQKRFNYGQRCRPVSLDDYSVDNVSVYNSVRRKAALRASKRSYGNPAFDDPVAISHPLNFKAISAFAVNMEDVKAEFDEIPQITAKTTELPEGCETKNRYANVIPLPETRVFLTAIDGYPTSDYINANYVTGPKNTKGYYIACQAPLSNTVDDFWRMIWEQQSKVILMLTHLFENGVEKCLDYLPPSEVLDCHRLFGDFQVTLKKREVKDKYVISSLQLKNMVSNSWREVTHFWYLGWPEKGVPEESNSLIAYLIEARSCMKTATLDKKDVINGDVSNGKLNTETSPVVVHCSPGTGRTGTVITCDIAIREFEQTRQVDIPKIVYRIRRDRASAVQTKEQYAFIYKVISLYATKLAGGGLESI